MEQKLETLSMISFDNDNIMHNKVKREFLFDSDFRKYFGEMFLKDEEKYFKNSDHIELKKVYFIKDNDQIIGLVRFFSYHELGFVNIQYAVLPDYRRQGYGKKIVKELTNYLMKNYDIKCIEADIDKNNVGSIKTVLSVGYQNENGKYKYRR